MKAIVISAVIYFQNFTQQFDAMLKTKLMNGVYSLFECGVKMRVAFFRRGSPLPAERFVFEAL